MKNSFLKYNCMDFIATNLRLNTAYKLFIYRIEIILNLGGIFMWIITRYLESNISMFEFEKEEEAREALKNMKGCVILSEVIYFNDPCFQQDAA
jgi:membrane protein YqaA with SNARE-associated domain